MAALPEDQRFVPRDSIGWCGSGGYEGLRPDGFPAVTVDKIIVSISDAEQVFLLENQSAADKKPIRSIRLRPQFFKESSELRAEAEDRPNRQA